MRGAVATIALAACRVDPIPVPTVTPTCAGVRNTAGINDEALHVALDGCGDALLGGFTALGSGEFAVDLFGDAVRVLPRITALSDGALDGLWMHGAVALAGDGPLVAWRLGDADGVDSGGIDVAGPIARDADGRPLPTEAGSSWAGLVGREDGASALVGAVSAGVLPFRFTADADGAIDAVWGGAGQGSPIAVSAGDVVYLDPVTVVVGADPEQVWAAWSAEVARALPALVPAPAEVGWIAPGSEAGVAADLARAPTFAAEPDATPFGWTVVGEGWAASDGDWVAGAGVPGGTEALAAEIAAAGLVPGLWFAPFRVAPGAPVHAAHPDWFVRDAAGAERTVDGRALLDVTVPDAADWLAGEVTRLRREGWRALWLAHLSDGALDGVRAEPVTALAAYGLGMDRIRDAAGPVWLVGEDAPLLPSAGRIDGRVDGVGVTDAIAAAVAARGPAGGALFTAVVPVSLGAGDPVGAVAAAVAAGGVRFADALAGVEPGDPGELALRRAALSEAEGARASLVAPLAVGPYARWSHPAGWTVLLNPSGEPSIVDGPGGVELLSGISADPAPRDLGPLGGEVWR